MKNDKTECEHYGFSRHLQQGMNEERIASLKMISGESKVYSEFFLRGDRYYRIEVANLSPTPVRWTLEGQGELLTDIAEKRSIFSKIYYLPKIHFLSPIQHARLLRLTLYCGEVRPSNWCSATASVFLLSKS